MQKTILFFLMPVLVFVIAADAVARKRDPENGRRFYQQLCVQCHGIKGDGSGSKGSALDIKPADHTDKKVMSKRTDAELYNIIWNGGKSAGLSSMMPSWRNALKDDDVWDIISHIRILCNCNGEGAKKK